MTHLGQKSGFSEPTTGRMPVGSAQAFPAVRLATAEDHEAAAETLALAFVEDPVWSFLIPEEATRAERLLEFFAAEIASTVPAHRTLWVVEGGSGAALWAAPGAWAIPFSHTLRSFPLAARVFGRRLPLASRTLLRVERRHPRGRDHWYLDRLGVEPRHQGRGLGAALLAPVLEVCDAAGLPAYLEASSERNAALYARNRFALGEVVPVPAGGPPIRLMWREPADPG